MLSRLAAILTSLLVAASIAATVAPVPGQLDRVSFVITTLSFLVPVAAFSVVGWLISSRRPDSVIGWLLVAIGFLFSLVAASSSVVRWGLRTDHLPEAVAGWIEVCANVWVIALGLIGTQLLLRLPDGRLPSRRWRWYSWATIVLIAVSVVGMATVPGRLEGVAGTRNPLSSDALSQLSNAFLLVIVSFVVSIVALVLRYRRSSGRHRAQLRWVAFSGAVFVSLYIVNLLLLQVVGDSTTTGAVLTSVIQMAFAALPVGIGFAMLRHDLYDIDVVINRALVYGSLTAMLAGTYLASVLLLQLVLERFTEGSGPAVAVSTLATAALVRPARSRIQTVVDRRFFRQRYDATQTLAHFGTKVRREVDLADITAELVAVAVETMQPAHAGLWLPTHETVTISGRPVRRQEST